MSSKRWFAWKPLGSHFSSCNKPEQWFYHFKVIYISPELHDTMAMLRNVAVHHLHKWHNFHCCDNHSQSLYHTYKPASIRKNKYIKIKQSLIGPLFPRKTCNTWLSMWKHGTYTEKYGLQIGSLFCLPLRRQDFSFVIFHSCIQHQSKKQIQCMNTFIRANSLHCRKEQFVGSN